MFTTRTLARTTLAAAAIGFAALGTAGIANATADHDFKAQGNVCYSYDYGTQVFYDCH
jgi:hypothetical protein